MVVNTGIWATTIHDDARMNRMTNISNTGAVLAGLDKTKFGLFLCTLDGSGLFKDHVYLCNTAGDALIDITVQGAHAHTSDTSGGSLQNIFQNNNTFFDLALTRTHDLKQAQWATSITSSGAFTDGTGGTNGDRYIKLSSGVTSGGAATITYPHMVMDFSKSATYGVKHELEATTALAFHTGVHCDTITAADSNNRKLQAEVCTVTNNNYWLRTANGSANSASDSGFVISTSTRGLRINHFPDIPEADMFIGGTTLQKTSNIPIDSVTAQTNLIRHSIKNSAAADKAFRMYGCRLTYYVSDYWA